MDTWKFYDITHRDHVVCNPTSVDKLSEVVGLLDLPLGPRVLDIACGKGELLSAWPNGTASVAGSSFHGVGVDLSPFAIADVRETAARRTPGVDLELVEANGADYRPEPGTFDLASCLGASWVFGGHPGRSEHSVERCRPGGLVLVGEPFWRTVPDPDVPRLVGAATRSVRESCGQR